MYPPVLHSQLLPIMDDLENSWGVDYVPDNPIKRRSLSNGRDSSNATTFKNLVSKDLGASTFCALHVASCGSVANLWAINDATGCDTSRCLIAAGSYVAGDGGPLQPFSSSKFDLSDPYTLITPPEEMESSIARNNTVALPYYIPGSLSPAELMKYEDECLNSLNVVLQRAGMSQKPYKALFLELILAGNGGTLSDRCLINIAAICRIHDVRIIIDEIMTGARTAKYKFLLCQTKPKEFRDLITHVTLGKWLYVGVVLCSTIFTKDREKMYGVGRRGASTELFLRTAIECWRSASDNIRKGVIMERRRLVLAFLSVNEEDSWGQGCLIFAPVARKCNLQGLKIRYLPQLNPHLKIDSIPLQKKKSCPYTKRSVNAAITSGILSWARRPLGGLKVNDDLSSLTDYYLCQYITENCEVGECSSADTWRKRCFPKNSEITLRVGNAALARAADYGILQRKMMGKARKRFWVIREEMFPPWKKQNTGKTIA